MLVQHAITVPKAAALGSLPFRKANGWGNTAWVRGLFAPALHMGARFLLEGSTGVLHPREFAIAFLSFMKNDRSHSIIIFWYVDCSIPEWNRKTGHES